MMNDFATIPEIVAMNLPTMPTRVPLQARAEKQRWARPEWKGTFWRPHNGLGGGIEYSYKLLPKPAQLEWVRRMVEAMRGDVMGAEPPPPADHALADHALADHALADHALAWAAYQAANKTQKQAGMRALLILSTLRHLKAAGWTVGEAIEGIREEHKVSRPTIMRWQHMVRTIPREHWLAYLTPAKTGPKAPRYQCSEEAWSFLKTDWLRPEKPTLSACYRRLSVASANHGWVIPSKKTLSRWLADLPVEVVTLAREGREALKQLLPAQERDRTCFHAMQAVNADGHLWDVRVLWPDGTIGRPLMVAWQDLYSNMILSWRVDRSENTDAIQLALGDMVEEYGIPSRAYLDNGRAFASKRMTGGAKTRFRFKIREGDAAGIMTILGIETIFVTPYSGQSKPIERAFRDLAGDLAKHPEFAGAYTGNSPVNKPSNYGEKAVPLETFLTVIAAGIEEYNTRPNRRTDVCRGLKSFRQAFEESLSHVALRKPTPEQRHLWLRAAENVMASRRDGSFRFLGNRYWAAFLREHMGERLIIRFDPRALHENMHVYSPSGVFLGDAAVIEKTGFDNLAAASEKKRAEKQLLKAARLQLEAERALSVSDLAKLLPVRNEPGPMLIEQKLVTPFRPNPVAVTAAAPALVQTLGEEDEDKGTASILNFIRHKA